MKNLTVLFLFFVLTISVFAQKNTTPTNPLGYEGEMNIVDEQKQKQGFWEEQSGEFISYGYYADDKKTGTWISYHRAKGIVFKMEEYKDDKLDGAVIEIDRRGYFTGERHYKKGLLHGKSRKYNRGATLLEEADYFQGKLNGVRTVYYENKPGKVLEEAYYKMGIKNGSSKWFGESGNLIADYTYKDGEFDGINKTYYENGTLMIEEKFENGVPVGEYVEYHQNGIVKIKGSFENGLKEGKWYVYDEAGKEIDILKYKKGEEN